MRKTERLEGAGAAAAGVAPGASGLVPIALAAVVLTLFGFPWGVFPRQPVGPGLDPSYAFALGYLAHELPRTAGEWTFPYGPLGHWLVPTAGSLAAAGAFRLLALAAFVGLMVARARSTSASRLLAATAVYVSAAALGLGLPGFLVLTFALLLSSRLGGERWRRLRPHLHVGALALPVLGAMKLDVLAGCGVALLVAIVLDEGRSRERLRVVGSVGATLLVAAVAVAFSFFDGVVGACRWLRWQVDLALGFSGAMGVDGPAWELGLGVVLVLLMVALALASGGQPRDPWWWLVLGPTVLSFRHAFARQDEHVLAFFGFVAAALGAGWLRGAPERAASRRLLPAASGAALVALGLVVFERDALRDGLDRLARAPRGVLEVVRGVEAPRSEVAEVSRRQLAGLRLPDGWRPPEGSPRSFDVVPWQLALIAANDLPWRPSPTLQLYTAYTAGLDRLAARHFESARAPESILLHFGAVDRRHPVWDTPATWRALLENYRFGSVSSAPRVALLVERPAPAHLSLEEIGTSELTAAEWRDVPRVTEDHLLFVEIRLREPIAPRVRGALLRPPERLLRVERSDGRRRSWRLVPRTAPGGLLVDPLPMNLGELAGLFAARPEAADPAPGSRLPGAIRIRLSDGEGGSLEGTSAELRWLRARRPGP